MYASYRTCDPDEAHHRDSDSCGSCAQISVFTALLLVSTQVACLSAMNEPPSMPPRRRRASLSSLSRLASPATPSPLHSAVLVAAGAFNEGSLDGGISSYWQTSPLAAVSAAVARERFADAGACILIAGPVSSILPVRYGRRRPRMPNDCPLLPLNLPDYASADGVHDGGAVLISSERLLMRRYRCAAGSWWRRIACLCSSALAAARSADHLEEADALALHDADAR